MAQNSPSTQTEKKEITAEEKRGNPKFHKEAIGQDKEFKEIYKDLSKEGVLKTLKEKRPDIFGNVKNFDEAMKILKEGKGETRDGIHHGLAERLEMNVGKTELQKEKKDEKEKQEKEAEKKKQELKTTDNKKEDKEKSESKVEEKKENKDKKNEKPKEENEKKNEGKKVEEEKEEKNKKDEGKKEEKKEKTKKEKKERHFWKGVGNAVRYPFRAPRNILKMLGRSVKTFGFEILNFPNPTRMKKVRKDYFSDMKSYAEKLKWNYKSK